MKRKILVILFILLIALFINIINNKVYAEDYGCDIVLEYEKIKNIKAGEQIIIKIVAKNINNENGIALYNGVLEYDKNQVSVEIEKSEKWNLYYQKDNNITLCRNDLENSREEQELGRIILTAKKDIEINSELIKLTNGEVTDGEVVMQVNDGFLKMLTKIEITNPPVKTSYIAGQNFDKTGMVVRATYNDGTSKEVDSYEVIGEENLTEETESIKIIYTENGISKETTQEITVEARKIEKLTLTIKDYEEKVEENAKYIKGIKPQTTLESFKNNIETNGTIKVKKEEIEITDNSAKIGTGMKIEITLNDEKVEYMLVVIGDCNGSGTTNVADLTKLMMSRAESLADNKDENKILKGAYSEAADLNNDGRISVADITKLCMYIAENKQFST